MATPVPTDKTVTLKDEEYVELGRAATEEVLRLANDMDNWLPTNHSDEQCQIYTRGSLIKGAAENMLMLQTTIDAPAERLYEILAPWKEYRMKWDDMLEDISIITSLPEEVYVIRHLVRKRITLSPRESIDVVKVLRKEGGMLVFGATGSTHAAYPPTKGYVRTHQYIGGYVLKPIDDNNTAITVIFHADLNLPGPKLFSSFADKFKPKLMIENIRNLREASKKLNISLNMSEKASFAAAASQLWNQNKEVIGNRGFNINLKVENNSDEKNTSSKDIPKTGFVFGSNLAARVSQQVEKKDDGPKSAAEILQSFSKNTNSTGFGGFTTGASTSTDWLKSASDDQPKIEDEPVEKPITGEEDETNIFQATCKIFQYDAEAKAWKERGLGTLRLNENNDFDYNNPARSRLVARSAGSQKVLINSPLFYEMVFEAVSEKRLKISATAPDSSIPQLFLIQSTPSLIGQLKALLRTRLKKAEINTLEESIQRKRKATETDGGSESKKPQNGGKTEKDGTEASGEDSTNESEDYDSSANDS